MRLIREDLLTETIKKVCCHAEDESDLLNAIEHMPSVEVVHGEWITKDHWYYCSNCGHEMFFTGIFDEEQRYCYYCGAKMDGKEKNNAE